MPGIERSARAPSSTSTVTLPRDRSPAPRALAASSVTRWLTMLASSAIRRAVTSAVVPVSDRWSRLSGRLCGSQRSQSQSAAPRSSDSTISVRSFGLCRVAACATSQRAVDSTPARWPAMPSTPTSGSSTVTGTSRSVGGFGRSLALPPVTSIADGSREMPSRSSSRSGSERRRSHSRRRGPRAVTSTVAGSGES